MPRDNYAGLYELGAADQTLPASLELRQGTDGVWRAEIHLPSGSGTAVKAAASAAKKATAIAEASAMADRIMQNPLVSAVMPPQAKAAVKALQKIAAVADSPQAKAVYRTLTGPGAKRLFRAISSIF